MEAYGYVPHRVLGRGAFGQAVLAKSKSGQWCVAKQIVIGEMDPKRQPEARQEIQVLQKLSHPNIVRYIDSFERLGTLYIMMEYADSGDLTALLKRQTSLLPEARILPLFTQICGALEHVHSKRILHRDLKSANVFLSDNGRVVKVGDFGISTVLRSTCAFARTQCGTPYYFSPELCMNRPYNNKSDIWSLGCILFSQT
eukprot:NODE_4755_length_745_cov_37.559871_g4593_i0.p2 GENE.NODE_4755_length_745_cov_37.559871_g4593_i0~~NODE_4755_length_745_cov_37.559871_g4593_i0.p2  ORF type:complete len:199 (-),score=47.89 NODE_4755_length_745_cov_37.559871_g4593_i0:54-650(-)